MYSFTDEEFAAQVKTSKEWGDPTAKLMDMMEELIIDEARTMYAMPRFKKGPMVDASIKDFESSELLQGLVNNAQLDLGATNVVDNFISAICCTFKHFNYSNDVADSTLELAQQVADMDPPDDDPESIDKWAKQLAADIAKGRD